MPFIDIRGTRFHYEMRGEGPQTIVFSHGLLFSGKMWERQMDYFSKNYRCVCFDHRGQGQTETTEGGYDMDEQAEDAAFLIEKLGLGKVHFVGLSMGGFVGFRLAARRPDLLHSLVAFNTTGLPENDANVPKYNLLCWIVKFFGVGSVMGQVMPIMFGKTFLTKPKYVAKRKEFRDMMASNHKNIVRAVKGVTYRKGCMELLPMINIPTFIIAGEEDNAISMERAKATADAIPNSRFEIFHKAGHQSTMEQPEEANSMIELFISSLELREKD